MVNQHGMVVPNKPDAATRVALAEEGRGIGVGRVAKLSARYASLRQLEIMPAGG